MPPRLIVEEPGNVWAGALRQLGIERRVPLEETRTPASCLASLSRSPTSVVAVAMEAKNVRAALGLVAAIDAGYPAARCVVLAERACQAYVPCARELGAVWCAVGRRELIGIGAVLERHLAKPAKLAAVVPQTSVWERIERDLPLGS